MATTLNTPVFLGGQGARERLSYERTPEFGVKNVGSRGRDTRCYCESIDELQDEETRECTAKIGDADFVNLNFDRSGKNDLRSE